MNDRHPRPSQLEVELGELGAALRARAPRPASLPRLSAASPTRWQRARVRHGTRGDGGRLWVLSGALSGVVLLMALTLGLLPMLRANRQFSSTLDAPSSSPEATPAAADAERSASPRPAGGELVVACYRGADLGNGADTIRHARAGAPAAACREAGIPGLSEALTQGQLQLECVDGSTGVVVVPTVDRTASCEMLGLVVYDARTYSSAYAQFAGSVWAAATEPPYGHPPMSALPTPLGPEGIPSYNVPPAAYVLPSPTAS